MRTTPLVTGGHASVTISIFMFAYSELQRCLPPPARLAFQTRDRRSSAPSVQRPPTEKQNTPRKSERGKSSSRFCDATWVTRRGRIVSTGSWFRIGPAQAQVGRRIVEPPFLNQGGFPPILRRGLDRLSLAQDREAVGEVAFRLDRLTSLHARRLQACYRFGRLSSEAC